MKTWTRIIICFGLMFVLSSVTQAQSDNLDRNLLKVAASTNDDPAVVQQLLEKGANIEAKNQFGETALMHAAKHGHANVVKLLLDKGSNIEAKDKTGGTALMTAAAWGRANVVKLLLDKGANVDTKNQNGRTALMCAVGPDRVSAANQSRADVVKQLLDKGANIEDKDNEGRTALILANSRGKADVIKLLEQSAPNNAPQKKPANNQSSNDLP